MFVSFIIAFAECVAAMESCGRSANTMSSGVSVGVTSTSCHCSACMAVEWHACACPLLLAMHECGIIALAGLLGRLFHVRPQCGMLALQEEGSRWVSVFSW